MTTADTVGWPQLTREVAAQDAALLRAGEPPTSIFASCRVLATDYAPDHVQTYWTGLQIGVCTGPVAGWRTLWPHLKHYD